MLLSAFYSFLALTMFVLGDRLPEGRVLPANMSDLFQTVIDAMWGFDWIFPTATFLSIVTLTMAWIIFEYAIRRLFKITGTLRR